MQVQSVFYFVFRGYLAQTCCLFPGSNEERSMCSLPSQCQWQCLTEVVIKPNLLCSPKCQNRVIIQQQMQAHLYKAFVTVGNGVLQLNSFVPVLQSMSCL